MIKNSTTQKIHVTGNTIITEIRITGKQTIRKLASIIGRLESSVHCHLQVQEKRNKHPTDGVMKIRHSVI